MTQETSGLFPPTGTEAHPLEPFLPAGALLLMLGSFPPQKKRWSMDFFYPNLQNDMWRIYGLIFFGDKDHFLLPGKKALTASVSVRFFKKKEWLFMIRLQWSAAFKITLPTSFWKWWSLQISVRCCVPFRVARRW